MFRVLAGSHIDFRLSVNVAIAWTNFLPVHRDCKFRICYWNFHPDVDRSSRDKQISRFGCYITISGSLNSTGKLTG